MALEEFWQNVRRAARLIVPPNAVADSPRIPAEAIARRLASADLWLVRGAVGGYDEKDFPFLPPDELARLTAAVKRFRDVAGGVNPRSPATRDQVEAARPAFQHIVERLEFDRFGDAEAFRLGKQIEATLHAHGWPPHLDHLRFRTGLDSTDDPAIWVWVFVAEETEEYDEIKFLTRANAIEDVLEPIARELAPEGRLYLRFRSTLDLPERQGVPA